MSRNELSLSALRARMGWSVEELAGIARTSVDSIPALEQRERSAGLEIVVAIGNAARLSNEDLGALLRGMTVLPARRETGDEMADVHHRLRTTSWVLVRAADATAQNNDWLGRAARGVCSLKPVETALSLQAALEMQHMPLADVASQTDMTEGFLLRIADRQAMPTLLQLVAIGQALRLMDEAFGALVRWAGARAVRGALLAQDPLWVLTATADACGLTNVWLGRAARAAASQASEKRFSLGLGERP